MKNKIKLISISLLSTLPIISSISVVSCQDSKNIKKQKSIDLKNYINQQELGAEAFVFINNSDFIEKEKQAKINSLFKFNKQLLIVKEKKDLETIKQNFELTNKNVYDYSESRLKEEEKRVNELMKKFEEKISSFISSKDENNFWKTYNIIAHFNNNYYQDNVRPFIDSINLYQGEIKLNELSYFDILADINKEAIQVPTNFSDDKSIQLILIEKVKISEKTKISLNKITTWNQFNSLKADNSKVKLSKNNKWI